MNKRQFLATSTGAAVAATGMLRTQSSANAQETKNRYGIEGQKAPEIKLDYWIDGNGEASTFSVLESRGKWVFLKCFQDWCPGCHSSGFPTLKAFADEFHEHPKVAIAGIQTVFEGHRSNTIEDVRKNQLKYELPIVMGHDPGSEEDRIPPITMLNYRTGGTPWLILIDPTGTVVFNNFHVDRDKLIEFVKEQLA